MKYFIDTEFVDDGHTIDLISIGIVAEDGRELYLQHVRPGLEEAPGWPWIATMPRQVSRLPDSLR